MFGEALRELTRRCMEAGMCRQELQRVLDLLEDDEVAADSPQDFVRGRRPPGGWLRDFLAQGGSLPLVVAVDAWPNLGVKPFNAAPGVGGRMRWILGRIQRLDSSDSSQY
jgi:hypothetical protein